LAGPAVRRVPVGLLKLLVVRVVEPLEPAGPRPSQLVRAPMATPRAVLLRWPVVPVKELGPVVPRVSRVARPEAERLATVALRVLSVARLPARTEQAARPL